MLQSKSKSISFLGFLTTHRGYLCYDLSTNKIIISQHVTFHETEFPFCNLRRYQPTAYDFLDYDPLIPPLLQPTPITFGPYDPTSRPDTRPASPPSPSLSLRPELVSLNPTYIPSSQQPTSPIKPISLAYTRSSP